MEAISSAAQGAPTLTRLQLAIVAIGYAAVLLASAALVLMRHLQYVIHANDVDASSGMWAFGDLLLELFIAALFLIPTLLLAFFIRNSETAYTKYSQILLGIAFGTPVCLSTFFIPAIAQSEWGVGWAVGWFCEGWVSAAPVFLVGLVCSRLLARFKRAKRLILYGLLIEIGTYALLLAAVVLPWHRT